MERTPATQGYLAMVLQTLITGIVNGAIYALFASGLSLLYGVGRVISVAHGTFFMAAAYLLYTFTGDPDGLQLPWVLGVVASLAILGAVAYLVFVGVVKPLRQRPIAIMLFTLGMAYAGQELIRLVYGPRPLTTPALVSGSVLIPGSDLRYQTARLVALGGSVVILLGLFYLLSKTRWGLAVRAVAQQHDAANLVGVRPGQVFAHVFILGSVLAAVAGVLVGPFLATTPELWLSPLIKSFAVVILGGLGSLRGTIVAALLIGVTESFVQFNVAPEFSDVIPFVLIILVLVIRPRGLYGKPEYA